MKLAIIIPGFQSSLEDWCIPAFTNLARELTRHAEVHVFTLRYPHRRALYTIGDVTVHAFGGSPLGGKRYPVLSALKLWRDTEQEVTTEHLRSPFTAMLGIWATESGWLATKIGRRLMIKTAVHLAGGELARIPHINYGNWGKGLSGWMVRRTLQGADHLFVPSGPVNTLLKRYALHAAPKAQRLPLGVDTALFSPAPHTAPSDPFTFVSVGSLIPVKGYPLLLESFALTLASLRRANKQRARLLIAGSGPLLPQLEAQITALGLQSSVYLLGEIPHHHLPAIYREAHAFLHGAWYEAQCMAALEAMSCGLPWIAPPVGIFPDIAHPDHPSGILARAHTPQSLSNAMLSLMSLAPDKRTQMGITARHRVVLKNYDLQKQTSLLAEALRALSQQPDLLTPPTPSDTIRVPDL